MQANESPRLTANNHSALRSTAADPPAMKRKKNSSGTMKTKVLKMTFLKNIWFATPLQARLMFLSYSHRL